MKNRTNTTRKGDEFEEKMYYFITELLLDDKLPITGKHSKVYRKKGYYSEHRKGNIIVDISIECTLPNEPQPSMYIMIECKDYNHPIPVDDLEEFYAKTKQITGLNIKAIFLTTNILQQGALNYAMSNGIRVMRIKNSDEQEILSYKKQERKISSNVSEYLNAFLALTSSGQSEISPQFVGMFEMKAFYSLTDLIIDAYGD